MSGWAIEGLARGANDETMEVSWSGISEPEDASLLKVNMEDAIYESFPKFFGCDPVHVEVHVKEPGQ